MSRISPNRRSSEGRSLARAGTRDPPRSAPRRGARQCRGSGARGWRGSAPSPRINEVGVEKRQEWRGRGPPARQRSVAQRACAVEVVAHHRAGVAVAGRAHVRGARARERARPARVLDAGFRGADAAHTMQAHEARRALRHAARGCFAALALERPRAIGAGCRRERPVLGALVVRAGLSEARAHRARRRRKHRARCLGACPAPSSSTCAGRICAGARGRTAAPAASSCLLAGVAAQARHAGAVELASGAAREEQLDREARGQRREKEPPEDKQHLGR
jgi:hypothetical protein